MTESGDGDGTATSLLVECLENPRLGKRRLPALVGLLEADDDRTRLAAAWTCCLVAVEHPDTVEYVVRRLSDRLDAGTVSLELTHALDYVADRYPEEVESVLAELDAEAAQAAEAAEAAEAGSASGRRDFPLPRTGRFTRSHYYGSEPDRGGVGRVRYPDDSGADDPRRTYTSGEPDERELVERRARSADERDAEGADDSGSTDAAVDPADPANDDHPAHADDGPTAGADADPGALVGHRPAVSSVAVRSRFDRLHILATHDRGRYADDYRALVGTGSEQRAVDLRLLNLPDEHGAVPAFEDAVREQLDRWAAVDDHDHVASLLDWGLEPRPWLATSVTGETLAEQDPAPRQALDDAIALAGAVAHLHRSDVVHGGIDPENVAYPGDVLEANDQDPPLLNNVGLLSVYRYHVDPATVLDPRYAAPEYFDRAFGRIDAATDVYQLGAVLFSLFAGRPPYGGSFDQVRAAVTDGDAPVPGDVESGVPAAVDEAVAKAMATRKLTRYETVEHLQQDLVAVREADVL